MTTIYLMTDDQFLQVSENPKIASGDQNSVLLSVAFDAEWDGYGKSAVFFTEEDNTVYEMVLTDNKCIIPHEVLDEAGTLYIGVRGVSSDNAAVKTSTLVKYRIEEGAPSGEGATVEPTASVYQQLIGLAEDTRNIAQSVRDDFEAGAIPALQEQNKKKGFMFWVGTSEEYEAQKDSLPENTFCVITDDTTKANMLNDIEAVKGVDLGTLPIQHDIFEFDYFLLLDNLGGEHNNPRAKWYTFHEVDRLYPNREIFAYSPYYNELSSKPDFRKLHFYQGEGGYMLDAVQSVNDTAPLYFDKVFGFKYPIKGE